MPALMRLLRHEMIVVLKCLDVIVRIGVEQVAEDAGVGGGAFSPHGPKVVAERVGNEGVPFVAGEEVVFAVAWRLGVGVVYGVEGLWWDEAEMFAPEDAAEGGGVVARHELFAVHFGGQGCGIFHHDREFGVVEAKLGAVVNVAAAADGDSVVSDQELFNISQHV